MKIVIFPGLDGTGTLVSEVEELLAQHHIIVTLQYPSNLYQYEDLRSWICGTLPQDDFVIVAESFSGPLAVMIASKNPTNLKGVIFTATFAKTPRKLPSFLTYIFEIIPFKSYLVTWIVQPLLMGKSLRKEFNTRFRHALSLVPASTIAGRLREVLKIDVTKELRLLETPFIYLMATNDLLVPSKMSLDFQCNSNAVVAIEGPHFLLQANPQTSAKHILDFTAHFC